MELMEGDVWIFGDNIDTDAMVPGQFLDAPIKEIAKHVFKSLNDRFAVEVKKGDIIVAGKNFGCGSSRENAPAVLKEVGISCIVAESFARIFFRNSIAIGLPVISCPDAASCFDGGNRARVDLLGAHVQNMTKGIALSAKPLPEEILRIIEKGGILNLIKESPEE